MSEETQNISYIKGLLGRRVLYREETIIRIEYKRKRLYL